MAAGPLFIVVEKNVKPSHGTQEKGLKCTGKKIYKNFSTIEFFEGVRDMYIVLKKIPVNQHKRNAEQ